MQISTLVLQVKSLASFFFKRKLILGKSCMWQIWVLIGFLEVLEKKKKKNVSTMFWQRACSTVGRCSHVVACSSHVTIQNKMFLKYFISLGDDFTLRWCFSYLLLLFLFFSYFRASSTTFAWKACKGASLSTGLFLFKSSYSKFFLYILYVILALIVISWCRVSNCSTWI